MCPSYAEGRFVYCPVKLGCFPRGKGQAGLGLLEKTGFYMFCVSHVM